MGEQEGYSHLISWSLDGMSFKISYDAKNHGTNKAFVQVLTRRFNQTHFKSFLRQLQLYGFERQFKGARKGECHHPLFQRHHGELLFGKSIEEYQDATCTQHAILATRMMCTNQQQQLELLSSSTQEVDTNLIPSPSLLQRKIASDEPTLSIGTSTSSNCKYRSTSPIPTTLKNLMLPDDDDDDDDDDDIDDDNQDNSNQDDYYDDDKNATTESNGSDNCSIDSNIVFNRTFFGTATTTVPISRKSKVLLMHPLIWNDICDDYEYDCDCNEHNVDIRDENNMILVDDHNNNNNNYYYDIPQWIGSSIYQI